MKCSISTPSSFSFFSVSFIALLTQAFCTSPPRGALKIGESSVGISIWSRMLRILSLIVIFLVLSHSGVEHKADEKIVVIPNQVSDKAILFPLLQRTVNILSRSTFWSFQVRNRRADIFGDEMLSMLHPRRGFCQGRNFILWEVALLR